MVTILDAWTHGLGIWSLFWTHGRMPLGHLIGRMNAWPVVTTLDAWTHGLESLHWTHGRMTCCHCLGRMDTWPVITVLGAWTHERMDTWTPENEMKK